MRISVSLTLVVLLMATLSAGPWQRAEAAPAVQATPVRFWAVVAVERANVFPAPDRLASPVTYLFERERLPVLGQTSDAAWLLIQVEDIQAWILRAQVDLEGDASQIPVVTAGGSVAPTLTITPFPTLSGFASTSAAPAATSAPDAQTATPSAAFGGMPVLPGEPPPVTITLPDGWKSIDLIVPYRTFEDDTVRDVPLTIYFGTLPDGSKGFIYLYWGFPNTVSLASGEYNLWADGAQILRFSLVGADCNLGVYDQRAFPIGDQEGVGAFYQAAECPDEPDTSGWFSVLRMYDGGFAFYVAVEPPEVLTTQHDTIQQILDTVEFLPPDTP